MPVIRVALDVPKRTSFDYLHSHNLPVGVRVQVPFGRRTMLGLVQQSNVQAHIATEKLKYIEKVLDEHPVLDAEVFALCQWLAGYYHHPFGSVLHAALPVALRKGGSIQPREQRYWQLTPTAEHLEQTDLKRAPKQWQIIAQLQRGAMADNALAQLFKRSIIRALEQKGLIESFAQAQQPQDWRTQLTNPTAHAPALKATVEQALAITSLTARQQQFGISLLEGITGSGKTEVFLQAIAPVLQAGKQVLILVPEIGLTPQTVTRFEQRFGLPAGLLHSGLSDQQRLTVWQQARNNELGLVIGTRSAIFTPFAALGMIIVDEEHDPSYKQQDGLRYHARDLAAVRAKQQNIPLLLGSATPSLESLNNAVNGRYQHLQLNQRATGASLPPQQLLDIRQQPLHYGLAAGMIERIGQHLSLGNQVLLFVNRRGYAPALLCHDCGHVEQCHSCDKPFTLHLRLHKLQCHHCGQAKGLLKRCTQCHSPNLQTQGVGTEQLEQGLATLFPNQRCMRIDSDSIRGKGKLQELLEEISHSRVPLLLGTQILSKGHHFPHVTLVVMLAADGALYSADYRAAERFAQLLTQVAGRAGRNEKPGEMWLQTHDPGHPLLQDLLHNGYGHFARHALVERKQAQLPPFSFQALLRAEANQTRLAHDFLQQAAELLHPFQALTLLGPVPALMEKRQGRYRMQLVVQSSQRHLLQQALSQTIQQIEALPQASKVRWSLDVDPQDFS